MENCHFSLYFPWKFHPDRRDELNVKMANKQIADNAMLFRWHFFMFPLQKCNSAIWKIHQYRNNIWQDITVLDLNNFYVIVWVFNTHLQHIEEDIELNNSLSPDQMVHHRRVYVVYDDKTGNQNYSFQYITYVGWLQTPVIRTLKQLL